MMRTLLFFTLIAFAFNTRAQNFNNKVSKAVQKVYSEYKLFFDSSLLDKYVVLDKEKSYLVNSRMQKIISIARADDAFTFDEFSLTFAFVYKGDTIKRFPACRLDTMQNMMALGTPSNPIRHGDMLPPYSALVKGDINYSYKKLQGLLQQMKIEPVSIDLKNQSQVTEFKGKTEYRWVVTTACPEIKCRELQVSATNGKILADRKPE
ncbi:MAG: hypothetical protein IPL54_10680 [Chitinophagaceae bacterium]|nr:hypothetical protein [Chitinophagaceae bacterium]